MIRIPAERIAVVKLGAIGDVVNSLPFVNRLRAGYPRAELAWVIGPLAHALVAGQRSVDRFLVFDARDRARWRPFAAELRAQRFDLVIDLQRILKSGLITRASGAPHRLGFDRARCKELNWLFTNERIPPNARPGVTVAQYLEFADHLGCPAVEPTWELPYEPFPRDDRARPRVVVNVGATKPANRWYVEKWAAVCAALVREHDADVHLTGGPGDRAETAQVARASGVPVDDQAGKLSLKESAGLIASADLFVGCDTGPMHVAAAVGTPIVALFGAADPARTGPFGTGHAVVRRPTPCSPCRRRECNVEGHPCMRELDVAVVLEAVRAALARRAARRTSSPGERA